MTTTELANRQSRAEKEIFIIAEAPDGFRICSPLNPAKQYFVTGTPEAPACSCPDFENHAADPQWRCKHILAVDARMDVRAPAEAPVNTPPVEPASRPNPRSTRPDATGAKQMLIKRSVSPDGHIDSLSVEITCPIGGTPEAVKDQADKTLRLQSEIIQGFLQANGKPAPEAVNPETDGAVPGDIVSVGGMPSKWGGRRLFLNVKVNGQVLKLFGTDKQLSEALAQAGFSVRPDRIQEGFSLNVPCRVVTKPSPDGKYTNIDRVMPAKVGNARNGGTS